MGAPFAFVIRNRFTDEPQFTCELPAEFADKPYSAQLGEAARLAIAGRANLRGAYLSGAYLSGADLRGADLSGANLRGADLRGAKDADSAIARTRILAEGALIGWKKCQGDVIVKLRIPEDAKRSHAFGRKCRAQFVDVLEVFGADVGVSSHDGETKYRVGERVTCDEWCEDWQQECAGGIHFFITELEAREY